VVSNDAVGKESSEPMKGRKVQKGYEDLQRGGSCPIDAPLGGGGAIAVTHLQSERGGKRTKSIREAVCKRGWTIDKKGPKKLNGRGGVSP